MFQIEPVYFLASSDRPSLRRDTDDNLRNAGCLKGTCSHSWEVCYQATVFGFSDVDVVANGRLHNVDGGYIDRDISVLLSSGDLQVNVVLVRML